MSATDGVWIGVAEVAAELHLTPRGAWGLLRRAGLKMLNPAQMGRARFRRADWEAARDGLMAPPDPPAAYVRKAAPATAGVATVPARKPAGAEKLARLRKGV